MNKIIKLLCVVAMCAVSNISGSAGAAADPVPSYFIDQVEHPYQFLTYLARYIKFETLPESARAKNYFSEKLAALMSLLYVNEEWEYKPDLAFGAVDDLYAAQWTIAWESAEKNFNHTYYLANRDVLDALLEKRKGMVRDWGEVVDGLLELYTKLYQEVEIKLKHDSNFILSGNFRLLETPEQLKKLLLEEKEYKAQFLQQRAGVWLAIIELIKEPQALANFMNRLAAYIKLEGIDGGLLHKSDRQFFKVLSQLLQSEGVSLDSVAQIDASAGTIFDKRTALYHEIINSRDENLIKLFAKKKKELSTLYNKQVQQAAPLIELYAKLYKKIAAESPHLKLLSPERINNFNHWHTDFIVQRTPVTVFMPELERFIQQGHVFFHGGRFIPLLDALLMAQGFTQKELIQLKQIAKNFAANKMHKQEQQSVPGSVMGLDADGSLEVSEQWIQQAQLLLFLYYVLYENIEDKARVTSPEKIMLDFRKNMRRSPVALVEFGTHAERAQEHNQQLDLVFDAPPVPGDTKRNAAQLQAEQEAESAASRKPSVSMGGVDVAIAVTPEVPVMNQIITPIITPMQQPVQQPAHIEQETKVQQQRPKKKCRCVIL